MDTRKYQPLPEPLLGTGGYGKVFKVRQKATEKSRDKILACKFIPQGSDSVSSTIQNEYERVKKLDHENIVRVEEFLSRSKFSLIFMEFCEGGNLKTFIEERKVLELDFLDEHIVLDVAVGLASALDYCHRRSILHKDIKPENVLVSSGLHVKLCDFGLIEMLESDGKVTGSRKSTLRYMAPEIDVEDSSSTWTAKCDVFSLGCTLYELASYCPASPFQIKENDDLPSAPLPDKYHRDLERLVMECMAISETARPQMIEVLEQGTELRNQIAGEESSGSTNEGNPNGDGKGERAGSPAPQTHTQPRNFLHWAAAEGDENSIELTKLLLSILEDVNISEFVNERDKGGRTPLWWAITEGRTGMAALLLDSGAVFDTDGHGGYVPLIKAVENGHDGIVERLLGLKDSIVVNGVDDQGESALHHAVVRGNVKTAALLLDRGALVDAPNANGQTALHKACGSYSCSTWRDMIELLLGRSARVEVGDDEGRTALHMAALTLHSPERTPDRLEFLLRVINGTGIDAVDEEGQTGLHVAATRGYAASVHLLLKAGADFDVTDNTSRTPLHITVDEAPPDTAAQLEIIDMLLEKGADVNRKDANGLTPLQKAVDRSLERVVERLLDAKQLVIGEEDASRSSTLHISAKRGLRDCVPLLLKLGASITAKNDKGQTPLHEALKRAPRLTRANRNYKNWIGLLMGHPEPDSRVLSSPDQDGNTPLHIAVLHKAKPDLVELLLEAFPKAASLRNKEGLLPYQCLNPPPAVGWQSASDSDSDTESEAEIHVRHSKHLTRAARITHLAVRKSIENTRGQVQEDDESKAVRDLLRYHYVRNMPLDGGPDKFHTKHQERRICFDLSSMSKPVTPRLLGFLGRQMAFEPILKYVSLHSEAVGPDEKSAAELVFRWLREKKGVQRILNVYVVDRNQGFGSEGAIQAALSGGFGIESWDWQKDDISIDTMVKVAPDAQLVRLYSSGNTSVLHAWSGKHGLTRLQKLRNVVVTITADKDRCRKEFHEHSVSLQDFKARIMKRSPAVEVKCMAVERCPDLGLAVRQPDSNSHHGWLRAMGDFVELLRRHRSSAYSIRHPANYNPFRSLQINEDSEENTGEDTNKNTATAARIAVIDDGVDLTDPKVAPHMIADGESFTASLGRNVAEYFICSSGHGTFMAGLIGRICPFAQLYVAKVAHGVRADSLTQAIEAVEWATKKEVDIIYIRTFSFIPNVSFASYERELVGRFQSAIKAANSRGIAIFCEGEDTEGSHLGLGTDYYDAGYFDFPGHSNDARLLPASMEGTVRIGAVRPGKGLESFQTGKLDYTFPGDRVLLDTVGGTTSHQNSIPVAMAIGLAGLIIVSYREVNAPRHDRAEQIFWPTAIKQALDVYASSWRSVADEMGDRAHHDSQLRYLGKLVRHLLSARPQPKEDGLR